MDHSRTAITVPMASIAPIAPTGSTAMATTPRLRTVRAWDPASWMGVKTLLAKYWQMATDTEESSAEFCDRCHS